MSQTLLRNFLHVAKSVTHAERGMAVDVNLQVLVTDNLENAEIESKTFSDCANSTLQEALETGKPVISNNMITDLEQAPTTNTNFADLRVVVALPLQSYGAIYLDQHIRNGIIPRPTVERLMKVSTHLVENQLESSSEQEIQTLFDRMR